MVVTRGMALSYILPSLARMPVLPKGLPMVDGVPDLREIVGAGTQELHCLENLAKIAILDPVPEMRTIAAEGLYIGTDGTVRNIYVQDDRIFIKLEAEGCLARVAYVCDVPADAKNKEVFRFSPQLKAD